MTKDSASLRTVSATRQAWFFCNPFLEEKTFSHVVYVHFARQMATLNRTTRHWHSQIAGNAVWSVCGEAHCTNLLRTDLGRAILRFDNEGDGGREGESDGLLTRS